MSKLTSILTIVSAGAVGLTFSVALAATAPTSKLEVSEAPAKVTKKLDRDWVWKKKAVRFDGMIRNAR